MRSIGLARPFSAAGNVTSRSRSGGSYSSPWKENPSVHGACSSIQALSMAIASAGSGSPSLGIR